MDEPQPALIVPDDVVPVGEPPEPEGESNLVRHARAELARVSDMTDPMERQLALSILLAVRAFSMVGHSGSSAAWATQTLSRLLQFEQLGPLTSDPDEWTNVAEMTDGQLLWQSKRCAEAFSEDGGRTHYLLSARDRGDYEPVVSAEPRAVQPELDPDEDAGLWLDLGIRAGWASPQFCAVHDATPVTDEEEQALEEDEGGEGPCLAVTRLW